MTIRSSNTELKWKATDCKTDPQTKPTKNNQQTPNHSHSPWWFRRLWVHLPRAWWHGPACPSPVPGTPLSSPWPQSPLRPANPPPVTAQVRLDIWLTTRVLTPPPRCNTYPDWVQVILCASYPDWVQRLPWLGARLTLTYAYWAYLKKNHVSSLQLFFTTILCWWSLMSYSNLSSMLYMSFVSNSSSMLYMSFVSNLSWMLYMSFLSRFFSKLYTSFLSNSSSMLDTSFLTNSSSMLYTSFLSNSSSMLYTLFLTNSSPMLYTSFLTQLRFSALHLISPQHVFSTLHLISLQLPFKALLPHPPNWIVSSYLGLVVGVGAEHLLDPLGLLQQLGHGTGVVLQLGGPLLLGVEHLDQVVAQPQCHLQASKVPVIAGEDRQAAVVWELQAGMLLVGRVIGGVRVVMGVRQGDGGQQNKLAS